MKGIKLLKVTTCKPNDKVVDVAKLFENNVRHVIVEEKKKPLGIISASDIVLRLVAEKKDAKIVEAKNIMTKPVDYVDINQEVEFALKIMLQNKTYNCLVCEKDKIKGTISYKQAMEEVLKNIKNES